MSAPSRCTVPEVGRIHPERRLKNDVLPAPFGPIIPTSSPRRTSSETPDTIVAPPMSSPRFRVTRIEDALLTTPACRFSGSLPRDRLVRWCGLVRRRRAQHRWDVAAAGLVQLDAEHRLQR